MPRFSQESLNKLATVHPDLQFLFNIVIKYFDCKILCGHRNQADQDQAFATGNSKLKWPNGNHNKLPSNAVDAIPCPLNWNDTKRIIYFAGFVMAMAEALFVEGKITHKVRWGGDWDRDTELSDNTFNDLVHFELIQP